MSKITKIIYLLESPFSQRDYKRFGVEVFLNKGFQVFIYDLTPFLRPQVDAIKINEPSNYNNLIKFKRRSEVIAAINKQGRGCFIICLISYNVKTFCIFKSISKHDIPYAVYATASIPQPNRQMRVKNKAREIIYLTPRKFINYMQALLTQIPPGYLKINSAMFFFVGGAKTPKNPTVNHKTKKIWIHILDYDIYLEDKEEKNGEKREENIAVFLDEDYFFHSDYTSLGLPAPTSAEEYFPFLCNFFDYIETKLDLEVVIASHPRSHYEERPDYFHGRKVMRGATMELVKKAKLVILHSSTSINFPVLYKKPMVFVTTDRIEKSIYGGYISKFSSYFRKIPINISKNVSVDLAKEFFIYEEGYAKYKHDFIKMDGTEEAPFWQVVSNRIKSLDV